MSRAARELVCELVRARADGATDDVAARLAIDASYWDPERGEVTGRAAVAAALTGGDARLAVETLAASGEAAVAELDVQRGGRRYRATEVYELTAGAVSTVRAYFVPEG